VSKVGKLAPPTPAGFLPPPWQVVLAGSACLGLAAMIAATPFRAALAMCGAILCLIAVGITLLRMRQRLELQRVARTAFTLLADDRRVSVIADDSGCVLRSNAAASERFGSIVGRHMSDVLGRMLANPEGIISNLVAGTASGADAAEDIVTRQGHFRLRLVRLGLDCNVWQLEKAAERTAGQGPVAAAPFPSLTVDSAGTVHETNAALRKLIGRKPSQLSDVITDLPLRSGQQHDVKTPVDTIRAMVAEVPIGDDRYEVHVLAGATIAQPPPQIAADWDAIEDLPVPLLKIAKDGQLLGSNREARQLLHMPTSQGRKLSDVLDGPGRPINDWLSEALAGRSGNVSQFLRGRGENQDTFVQVTLSTSADPGEEPHLIAVLNDVTELKTLEAQFVQSQKMQAIGQLAGGVAHDFNNLLTAISGHCDLLLLHHDEHDQNYGDLIQIHQNANRAASLVGQLLAFSRKQNLQLETIDLRDTLSDLTHLLNRLVGEKVQLTLDHDPDLASIKADKRQLEQVLMNLVVNARDAMDGAGEIRVVTENRKLEDEIVRDRAVVPPGEYVVVSVIDEGHGIAPDKLPKIFEPFWTTKQTGEGTGLGLSTAYGIVKQTGGFIFADSVVGEGTTFSLMFPRHVAKTVAPIMVAPQAQRRKRRALEGVVLLVEDEAPVRAFASRALRLRGYTVMEADCAEAALDLLEDEELRVDIFVTDVIMPGMDGPTWVRAARQRRPDTRVVFVSGYPEDAFDDGEAHIPDAVFLPKPFSLSALTETVDAQLDALNADPALDRAAM